MCKKSTVCALLTNIYGHLIMWLLKSNNMEVAPHSISREKHKETSEIITIKSMRQNIIEILQTCLNLANRGELSHQEAHLHQSEQSKLR